VLAWREVGHTSKRYQPRDTDAKWYPNVPTNVTYSMVTYWRARVVVRAGETVEITMNDRSVWMAAGRQESGTPVAPRAINPAGPQRR